MSKKDTHILKTDIILEIISWFFLLVLWLMTIISFQTLPDKIPTHFNFEGIADNFGSKSAIFNLPVIATILIVGLTILNKFLNSSENERECNNSKNLYVKTRIIKSLKIAILVIIGMIIFHTVEIAKKESEGLGIWLLISTIMLTNIPTLYYLIKLKFTKEEK